MRPLILKMTAFGPFPATETIDFSVLGSNPLFLINGPTGSGKTTILDAICFALYGKTTGDERDGAQMRCDLAAAETLCEVTFEFELDGCQYRISRRPEQQRPKTRGDGLTDQKPTATLVKIPENGDETLLLAAKVSDTTREIENLTGLSVDQFRQVMILPQGKFRQLLLAESTEREKIFGKLFQTHIYKQLENKLKDQAAQVRRERDDLRQQQLGILEAVEVESVESLTAEIEELQPQVKLALAAKQQAEAVFLERTKHLQQQQALQEEFLHFEHVETEMVQLKEHQNQIEQQQQQLHSALEAEKLRPLFSEQQRCAIDVEKSEKKKSALQRQLQLDQESLQQTQQQLLQTVEIVRKQDKCKVELAQLDSFVEKLSKLDELRQQCANQRQQVVALTLFNQIQEQEQRLRQLKELSTLSAELSRMTKQLEDEELTGKKLSKFLDQQTVAVQQLELSWHRGQAAILAAELKEEHPCPVCGSLNHPAPAHSETELPSQSDLENARAKLQETTINLEAARDQYRHKVFDRDQLQLRHDDLQKKIDSSLNYGQLMTDLSTLRQKLSACKMTTEITVLAADEREQKQLADQHQLTTLETKIALLEKDLPGEYRRGEDLQQRKNQIEVQLNNLEKQHKTLILTHQQAQGQLDRTTATLKEVDRQLNELQRQLNRSSVEVEKSLAASCFATPEDYCKSLLEETPRQQLQATIETFNARFQNLSGAYEQLQRNLENKVRPDLEKEHSQLLQAEEEKGRIEREWKIYDSRLQILEETRLKLDRYQQRLKDLDDRYAVVGTLSDVANGQTGHKISLQRFVLSVLLDDVLFVASERFSLMSKGRYRLLRNEGRSKGNKASGLNLLVDDAYTGKIRSVATLSGGESFMAALSLALGLSDVVQSYAGGIHLDTLFIDEGFGSLDSESLDLAVRTLIDLQASGRIIGVISHVAELKEQIPLRIDVASNRSGSSIKLAV